MVHVLSSRAQTSKEPTSSQPKHTCLPLVAPCSLCTFLQSQVPTLVPGIPARCPGLATQRLPLSRQPSHAHSPDHSLASHWAVDSCHSVVALKQLGNGARAADPLTFLLCPCTSFHPRGPRVAAHRSSSSLPWALKYLPGFSESTFFMLQCCTFLLWKGRCKEQVG